jgi:hypothetical protein
VTLTTLHAVPARAGRGRAVTGSRRVLTLAAGAFAVPGGRTHQVALRLRPRARALLSRMRSLAALATLHAHDSAGANRTTHTTVALHLAVARRG